MSGDLILGTLAEEDTDALRGELAALSELLAEGELRWAELRAEVARFQHRYYRSVGARYVQLDDLEARIAEKRASRHPEEEWSAGRARRRRAQAERSADDFRRWEETAPPPPPEPRSPTTEAKRLYRRIAGIIHPDRAEDEGARKVRTALMAELNAAYARGDIRGMEDILRSWDASPEAVAGTDRSAELERLQRTVARVRTRLEEVESEITRLVNSPLHRLMVRVREASARGRDLLAELAADLDRRIVQTRQDLAEL